VWKIVSLKMTAISRKAAEDCRTPRRFASEGASTAALASWSAAVLCRFRLPTRVQFWLFLLASLLNVGADTLRTLDGHSYRGKAALIDSGIQLSETNGNQIAVPLTNLDAVVFAEATDVI